MTKSMKERLSVLEGNIRESIGGGGSSEASQRVSALPAKDIGRRPDRSTGKIEVAQVIPDSEQPRTEFSKESINQLAQSIRDKGQLTPIKVRWSEFHAKWVIIFGERRWRATKQAGLTTINCIFCESDLSKSEILEEQIIENLHREDLNPIEQAKAFSSLMHLHDWTATQVAEALRVNKATVSRSLALLKLPDEVIAKVESGELSARSAAEISRVKDDDARKLLAEKAASGQLTHEGAAKAARQRAGKKAAKPRSTRESFRTSTGFTVTVSARHRATNDEIINALQDALKQAVGREAEDLQAA